MSAELLRRAAQKLREHATADYLTPAPWDCLDGGDRLIHLGADGREIQYVVDEPMSIASNAEYIALMHPPVALALSDWLDHLATASEYGARVSLNHAIRTARAVLREPAEPGPTTKDGSE